MFGVPNSINFETKRLMVRDIEMSDKEEIYALYSDPNVMQFDNSSGFQSLEETEQFIAQIQNPYVDDGSIRWAIVQKQTGDLIGTCGFRNWDRHSQHAEIGGNISSKYWRKGYATELLPKLIEYGFNHLQLNKIHAYTLTKNKAVLRLLKNYNFKKEGILRQYYRLDQGYEDVVIFGKLKSDEW
ncbi:GNAT family N-acetyltransferase [Desertibacillus haloalkaliphilus]|uniref:GNAT family N-acetyltransferase n=1 Tax=Desertibacillus haloalkaliphilus TaxID=1328930 RepID=UPI001FE71D9C|nr:GNAT family protein [Desertibacillus haloalkaliphilus]